MLPELASVLTKSGLDPSWAEAHGVREILLRADLPGYATAYRDVVPALGFLWKSVGGREVEQIRPLAPVMNGSGSEPSKYLWPPGEGSVLNVLRTVAAPELVLVTEGTKQALAALRYAPETWQIVGLGGCSSWTVDGVADPDLAVLVDGRDVVALFDADLDRNQDVWFAAKKLGEAAQAYGSASFKWAATVGRGDTGLDDVLGSLPEAKRAPTLLRMVQAAKAKLPAKPKRSAKSERIDWVARAKLKRPQLWVADDRLAVGTAIAEALRSRWDGSRLFMFGRRLTSVEFDLPVELNQEGFVHLVYTATDPLAVTENGSIVPGEYTRHTMAIARDKCDRSFTRLQGVTKTPFVRADGSVCTAAGYDADSELLLVPTEGLEAVVVPDEPTEADVAAAVALLAEDWLADFPFETQSDRANALALILTPFVRGQVQLAPLAVLDGRGAGVGKGLLADVLSVLVIGEPSEPVTIPADRTEGLKSIHAYASQAREFMMLDENHIIRGEALAMALTAPIISARTLGKSEVGAYPNRFTWLSAGNHVQLHGDLYRRCYRIALYPEAVGWANRGPGDFKHPDLARWTRDNRGRLMGACLTIIRSWYVKGCPDPQDQEFGFGSFEQWQRIVGGVLEAAGVEGFLANTLEWRKVAATDQAAWAKHLKGLWEVTKGKVFTVAKARGWVVEHLVADPLGYDPDSPDPVKDERSWGWAVGGVYKRYKDVPEAGLVLTKLAGEARGGISQWQVVESGGDGGDGGVSTSAHEEESICVTEGQHTHAHVVEGRETHHHLTQHLHVAIDFETDDAERLGQPGFIRIMGWACSDGTFGSTADPDVMRRVLTEAGTIITSGGTRFDLPAAAIGLGLPIADLAAKSVDTEVLSRLVEPPRATKGPNSDRYGLEVLGPRYAGREKDKGVLQTLKRRHKGYANIPLDDPDYNRYCIADAELSRDVTAALAPPDPDYWERERRVAGLAASLTARGLRVDTELLAKRLFERNEAAMGLLSDLASLGFPKAEGPTSVPWRTKDAGPVWDALAGVEWPRGKTGLPLTSGEMLDDYLATYPDGGAVEAAGLVKQITSAGSSFVYQLHPTPEGRVHPQHSLSGKGDTEGGATGRWSTSSPNVLGVGKRSQALVEERRLILAEPGEVLISIDLAGIDARAVAGLSGDEAYIELMRPGVDIHLEIAEIFFGERTVGARKQIKPYTHGIPYGRSAATLAKDIVNRPGRFHGLAWRDVAPELELMLERYYKRFHGIADWQVKVRSLCEGGGVVDNGFGRPIRTEAGYEYTQAPSRQAQSCARDLAMEGLFRLQDAGLWDRVVMFVHDEVVASVPAGEAEAWGRQFARLMSFDWTSPSGAVIPIIAQFDGGFGPTWADVY